MKQNGLNSMSFDCSKDSMVETLDFEIWNVVVTAATNTSTYIRRTKVNTDNSDIEIQEEPERPIAREETITKPIPRYLDRWQSTDYGWGNRFELVSNLCREADEVVKMMSGGKHITPTEVAMMKAT